MSAARISCPCSGYVTPSLKAVADAEAKIARIEADPRCCQGPHVIETWQDGAWRPIPTTEGNNHSG